MFLSLSSISSSKYRTKLAVFAFSFGALFFSGCAKRDETFLTVQMCVEDEDGIMRLKAMMRDAAEAENLHFVDSSARTGDNLKAMGADEVLGRDAASAINIGIRGEGGTFVMGGNLGLPPYQIALGFGTGSEPGKGHQLAQRLVPLLSDEWDVKTVPKGQGVFPMSSCGDSRLNNSEIGEKSSK